MPNPSKSLPKILLSTIRVMRYGRILEMGAMIMARAKQEKNKAL